MDEKRIKTGLALAMGTLAAAAACAANPPGLLEPVSLDHLPARRMAYVEQVGNFQNNPEIYDVLLGKLLEWAIPANIWNFPDRTLIVNVYPDDPSVPPENQRLWLGMTIDPGVVPPEGIHALDLPAGLHAVGKFLIPSDQFGTAWGYLYGEWLPQSGHVPAGAFAYELQYNDSSEHPEQKHRVDVCIPVAPLPEQ